MGTTSSRFGRKAAVALAAFTVVAVACGGGSDEGVQVIDPATTLASAAPSGEQAPSTPFELFDGTPATLASFEGAPVVMNFWASWCPSCVAEMSASFRPVQEQIGDRVTFLGMNIQDDRELALALLDETGVRWISAEDSDGRLYVELGGLAMPFTVYISADGQVLDTHNGPLSESQLRDQITDVFGV